VKIFITGITGFVGSMMANRFINEGHQVVGLGRKEQLPAHVDKRCIYIRVDITKPITTINADVVIHAAAQVSDKVNYQNHFLNNVVGTTNVLNACNRKNTLFIMISTSSVYSFTKNTPYTETQAGEDFDTLSDYGKTKYLAEQKVMQAQHINRKIILRPRAIYGKCDTVLLPRLLQLVKGNLIILPQHISPKISLTNIDNLIDAVHLCFKETRHKNSIYNVSDDAMYSLKETIPALIGCAITRKLKPFFISKVLWIFIVKINTRINFIPSLTSFGSKQLTQIALLDISHIKKELLYNPNYNFLNSLPEIRSLFKKSI